MSDRHRQYIIALFFAGETTPREYIRCFNRSSFCTTKNAANATADDSEASANKTLANISPIVKAMLRRKNLRGVVVSRPRQTPRSAAEPLTLAPSKTPKRRGQYKRKTDDNCCVDKLREDDPKFDEKLARLTMTCHNCPRIR